MVKIGTVTGSEVRINRDDEIKTRLLQCEIDEEVDGQTVELYRQAGEDYNPLDDSTVVILMAGKAWKIAVASDDGIEPITDRGERLLYSAALEGGVPVRKATVFFKKDGTLELNGADDNAASFADLKAGFDDLKDQIKTNLDAIKVAIAALGGSYTIVPLTASIDGAKIESIKVP